MHVLSKKPSSIFHLEYTSASCNLYHLVIIFSDAALGLVEIIMAGVLVDTVMIVMTLSSMSRSQLICVKRAIIITGDRMKQ